MKRHGAAVVVMAFDEEGQAATCAEKVRPSPGLRCQGPTSRFAAVEALMAGYVAVVGHKPRGLWKGHPAWAGDAFLGQYPCRLPFVGGDRTRCSNVSMPFPAIPGL